MGTRRASVPLSRRLRQVHPGLADPDLAIAAGEVRVAGRITTNPASMVRPGDALTHRPRTALRGEAKLGPALHQFRVDLRGRVALDVGACTGGFTRVLLGAGAVRVYAVDAGHGQLLGSLRQDARVVNLEATNVGILTDEIIPEPIDVITIDVSYLSLTAAVAQLAGVHIVPGAELIGLVKPMFELRRPAAPDDDLSLSEALAAAVAGVTAEGWEVTGTMRSPVTGSGGAREFLLHARRAPAEEDG